MLQSAIRSTPGFTQADYDNIVQAASSGQFVSFNPAGCKGLNMAKPVITSTVGGLALKFTPQAFAAGPIIGAAVLAIGGLATLFGLVFGHHAAAVAKEQKIVCAAVPSANDALAAIYDAVNNGTITPQQGKDALDSLLSQFKATVQPIIKMNSSQCNAACIWVKQLTAIVAEKKSQYDDLIGATSSSALSPSEIASATGLPSWALYAAAGFLLWQLL